MTVTKQFLSGVVFIVLGGGAATLAAGHSMGTTVRMGPGYFPFAVGSALAIVGAITMVRSILFPADATPVERTAISPIIIVSAAIVAFALLLRPYGLFAAVTALTAIGWMADRDKRLLELPLMIVVLSAIAYGIFVYGLNIPLRIWPV